MASTLDIHDIHATRERQDLHEEIVAVVDPTEFDEARQDPRVRSFLAEADAYLVELEQQGRNR